MARPRSFDEARVVAAARDVFARTGYADTSLEDLTAATGLGRGSLYGAFGDKHGLFLRAFDDYCACALDLAAQTLRGPAPALDRLAAHLRGVAEAVIADTERRGCLLSRGTAELAGGDEQVAERARRTLLALHAMLAEVVAEARDEGDLAASVEPPRLAAALLSAARGFEALGKAGLDPALIRDAAEATLESLPRR